MKENNINQVHSEFSGIESKNMTIEDLIRVTTVDVFDSRTFKGYQREINNKHVYKIEKYITDSQVLSFVLYVKMKQTLCILLMANIEFKHLKILERKTEIYIMKLRIMNLILLL